MNARTDARRITQAAQLAAIRDDAKGITETVFPALPEISIDAGVELVAALQAYRDHPVRSAKDLSTALRTIMGERLAMLIAEYLVVNLSEGGAQ